MACQHKLALICAIVVLWAAGVCGAPGDEAHSTAGMSERQYQEGSKSGRTRMESGITKRVDSQGRVIHRRHVVYEWFNGKWNKVTVDGPPPGVQQPPAADSDAKMAKEAAAQKAAKKADRKAARKAASKAARKAARRARQARRRLPATCNCKQGPKGSGQCYYFPVRKSSYCAARLCEPKFICVFAKTGLTCIRRKTRTRIVKVGEGRCKLKKVKGYMYVPYSE